ncbi:hypothetical protein [Aquicella lusitana]|uniref:Uncharacterized protein n=1 Tax=Aquicella lusitana TaxID=254246 RepID=A0A370G9S2_9COXI|nr:hypothetical protein [Aquicella lusitana]RDI39214.1 hypothetical protein C8D86_12719 [Aquicella lusitana]VVC74073.1 hypothetical protein AQULUS_18360 [Aquicella lusitana]
MFSDNPIIRELRDALKNKDEQKILSSLSLPMSPELLNDCYSEILQYIPAHFLTESSQQSDYTSAISILLGMNPKLLITNHLTQRNNLIDRLLKKLNPESFATNPGQLKAWIKFTEPTDQDDDYDLKLKIRDEIFKKCEKLYSKINSNKKPLNLKSSDIQNLFDAYSALDSTSLASGKSAKDELFKVLLRHFVEQNKLYLDNFNVNEFYSIINNPKNKLNDLINKLFEMSNHNNRFNSNLISFLDKLNFQNVKVSHDASKKTSMWMSKRDTDELFSTWKTIFDHNILWEKIIPKSKIPSMFSGDNQKKLLAVRALIQQSKSIQQLYDAIIELEKINQNKDVSDYINGAKINILNLSLPDEIRNNLPIDHAPSAPPNNETIIDRSINNISTAIKNRNWDEVISILEELESMPDNDEWMSPVYSHILTAIPHCLSDKRIAAKDNIDIIEILLKLDPRFATPDQQSDGMQLIWEAYTKISKIDLIMHFEDLLYLTQSAKNDPDFLVKSQIREKILADCSTFCENFSSNFETLSDLSRLRYNRYSDNIENSPSNIANTFFAIYFQLSKIPLASARKLEDEIFKLTLKVNIRRHLEDQEHPKRRNEINWVSESILIALMSMCNNPETTQRDLLVFMNNHVRNDHRPSGIDCVFRPY